MFYLIARIILIGTTKLFWQLKAYGTENIPASGSFILASNHESFLDVPCITSACPRRVHWVARKSLYEAIWLKLLLDITQCIPVNGATKKAIDALGSGKVMGVFPEGTRTYDGKLQGGKTGTAVLALKTGAKILPVCVSGSFEAFPRANRMPKPFMPITVKFGRAFSIGKVGAEQIEQRVLDTATEKIMSEIQSLHD